LPEKDRKTTEHKIYNLTWNGQITSKLCSFVFTSGDTYANEICFESLVYKLQWNMKSVEVNKCIALGFQQIVFGVYTQDDKHILLVEETGVPGGNHSPVASH
jgi:hypothetical protein